MKKLFSLLFASVMVAACLGMTGCFATPESQPVDDNPIDPIVGNWVVSMVIDGENETVDRSAATIFHAHNDHSASLESVFASDPAEGTWEFGAEEGSYDIHLKDADFTATYITDNEGIENLSLESHKTGKVMVMIREVQE